MKNELAHLDHGLIMTKNTQPSTVIMLVERGSMKTWQLLSWSHSYTECCTLKTVNRWWSNFLVSGRMCVCVLS